MIAERIHRLIARWGYFIGALLVLLLLLCSAVLAGSLGPRMVVAATMLALLSAASLFLIRFPRHLLLIALFLFLVPFGLRPEPISGLFSVAAFGMLAIAFLAWLVNRAGGEPAKPAGVTLFMLFLFMGWAAYTAIWAPDLVAARRKLVAYGIGIVLLFLVVQQTRTRDELVALTRVLALSGWLLLVTGVGSIALSFQPGHRLHVANTNQNELAMLLLAAMPGVLWEPALAQGRSRTILAMLCVVYVLGTISVVGLSESRGGAVSLVATLLAFLAIRRTRAWGAIGVALLISLAVAMPFIFEGIFNRLDEVYGGRTGGRDVLWQAGLTLFYNNLIAGVGIGNGPFELHDSLASLTSDYKHRIDLPSHNPLIEVGVDTGLVGLVLYSAACGAALVSFFASWRYWRGCDASLDLLCCFILASLVGFGASWIKSGGVDNHPNLFAFLMLLTVVGLRRRATAAHGSPPDEATQRDAVPHAPAGTYHIGSGTR